MEGKIDHIRTSPAYDAYGSDDELCELDDINLQNTPPKSKKTDEQIRELTRSTQELAILSKQGYYKSTRIEPNEGDKSTRNATRSAIFGRRMVTFHSQGNKTPYRKSSIKTPPHFSPAPFHQCKKNTPPNSPGHENDGRFVRAKIEKKVDATMQAIDGDK